MLNAESFTGWLPRPGFTNTPVPGGSGSGGSVRVLCPGRLTSGRPVRVLKPRPATPVLLSPRGARGARRPNAAGVFAIAASLRKGAAGVGQPSGGKVLGAGF